MGVMKIFSFSIWWLPREWPFTSVQETRGTLDDKQGPLQQWRTSIHYSWSGLRFLSINKYRNNKYKYRCKCKSLPLKAKDNLHPLFVITLTHHQQLVETLDYPSEWYLLGCKSFRWFSVLIEAHLIPNPRHMAAAEKPQCQKLNSSHPHNCNPAFCFLQPAG